MFQAMAQDTASITRYTRLAGNFNLVPAGNPDSSLFYLNKALLIAENLDSRAHLYSIFDGYSKVFQKSGNYSLALEYLFKMMSLLDEEAAGKHDTNSVHIRSASLNTQIGNCYFNLDNFMCLDYYLKSLEHVWVLAQRDPSYPAKEREVMIYINIGSAYLSQYDFAKAREYFERALQLNNGLNNPVTEASLYNNLGIVYKENKDFDKAFTYYTKALAIRQDLKDTIGMAQTYNNLGDALCLTGKYPEAIEALNEALRMSRQNGNIRSQMKAANFLSGAYENTGNYKAAFEMYRMSMTLHDSILNSENVNHAIQLEMQYRHEKQIRENELQQQITLARKERQVLVFLVISGLLLASVTIMVLLYRNQKIRARHHVLEKKNLEMELEFRNKELSTHVLYLLRKNEFISSIVQKLINLQQAPLNEAQKETWIQDIMREMQSNIDNTVWTEFEVRFQKVHKDFYRKLMEKYPDLTPNEIKICAFLKLNMTSKDISAITFQSVKTLEVARHRLRKKMGIDRDENLVSLLQNL
jgi:tetratricopeptide (TPR) repeat protein/DNA-binding CsgD family transcriptional regulator